MKKIFCLLIAFCLLLSTSVYASPSVVDTNIYANDVKLEFDKSVINVNGSTLYPMRELLNKLGVNNNNIFWDAQTHTVTVYANNSLTMFEIDSYTAIANGVKEERTSKPIIYNGSTYLPVRSVAAACGYDVYYDGETNTIYLSN